MTKSRVSKFKVNPEKIMKKLGQMLEQSKHEPDEDFFYDRMYFIKRNYESDEDTYSSDEPEDKLTVLEYDLETINILINQVLRWGRIVMSNDGGIIYKFPKNKIPKFEISDIFNRTKHNTIKTNMNRRITI